MFVDSWHWHLLEGCHGLLVRSWRVVGLTGAAGDAGEAPDRGLLVSAFRLEFCVKRVESSSEDGCLCRHGRCLAVAAAVVLGAGILTTGLPSEAAGGSTRIEDIGPEKFNAIGEQATGAVCLNCHGWDAIFGGPRQTADQWDFIVSEMVSRGAQAGPEQLDLIRRYLKWSWGVVWINSATAQDLAQVIGLSAKEAEAVVAWREAHGNFTDLESLKEVPGIDAAVIDAQADAIMFN